MEEIYTDPNFKLVLFWSTVVIYTVVAMIFLIKNLVKPVPIDKTTTDSDVNSDDIKNFFTMTADTDNNSGDALKTDKKGNDGNSVGINGQTTGSDDQNNRGTENDTLPDIDDYVDDEDFGMDGDDNENKRFDSGDFKEIDF